MEPLKYENSSLFLHCKNCLNNPPKGSAGQAPKDFNTLEAATYPVKYPDGHVENVIVIWCHSCQRPVWDTRHLYPRPTDPSSSEVERAVDILKDEFSREAFENESMLGKISRHGGPEADRAIVLLADLTQL